MPTRSIIFPLHGPNLGGTVKGVPAFMYGRLPGVADAPAREFIYAGQIVAVSTVAAAVCKGKSPSTSVAATSSFSAAVSKTKVPPVSIAAASTITSTLAKVKVSVTSIAGATTIAAGLAKVKASVTQIDALSTSSAVLAKTKVPPVDVDGVSTVAGTSSFSSGSPATVTYTYAGAIDARSTITAAITQTKTPVSGAASSSVFASATSFAAGTLDYLGQVNAAATVVGTTAKTKAAAGSIAASAGVAAATSFRPDSYPGLIAAVSGVSAVTSFFRQLTEEEGRAVQQTFYAEMPYLRAKRPIILPDRLPDPTPVVFEHVSSGIVARGHRVEADAEHVINPNTFVVGASIARSRAGASAGVAFVKALQGSTSRKRHTVRGETSRLSVFTAAGLVPAHKHTLHNETEPRDWQRRSEDNEILRLIGAL
jgi:hypothetical protein